jgi:signal transduction histidine kinase
MARSYLEANHSQIEVRSKPGQGATFIVTLPKAEGMTAGVL